MPLETALTKTANLTVGFVLRKTVPIDARMATVGRVCTGVSGRWRLSHGWYKHKYDFYMVRLCGLEFGNDAWGPGAARTTSRGSFDGQYIHNNRVMEAKSCLLVCLSTTSGLGEMCGERHVLIRSCKKFNQFVR
jgi:hypothetical protein